MTDFLDGELKSSRHQQIDDHLKICPACLEVKRRILEVSVQPFQGLTQIKPPESVWEGIEGRLDIYFQHFRNSLVVHPLNCS